jgi:hypothetical protein
MRKKKTTVKNQSETLGEYACVIVNTYTHTQYIPVQTNGEKKKSESGLYFSRQRKKRKE